MRNFCLALIALISLTEQNLLIAQGRTDVWLMGYQSWGGIPYGTTQFDFVLGNLSVSYNPRQMNFSKTLGLITDLNGSLLFYSNGIYVSNALDDTMLNGSDLNPSQYAYNHTIYGMPIGQGNLISPDIGDSNKYFLFHQTADYQINTGTFQPHELFYSVVDMTQDSGKGAVISKNNILLNDTLILGEITSVKHANGRDYWLIIHKAFSNQFYEYLITPSGISQQSMQQIGNIYYAGGGGQVAFSPNGSWYARYMPYDGLTIMQFDRCSGQFYNPLFLQINDSAAGGGVAFSPDSRKLYVPSSKYLYQFNFDSTNILTTKQTVAVWDSFYSPNPPFATSFYLAALANDGKIYINSTNSVMHLHIIDSPNNAGLNCNVIQHGLALPAFNAFTIPNFPNYFLGPVLGSVCDSLGLGVAENAIHNFNFKIYPNPIADNLLSCSYMLPQNNPSAGSGGTIEIYSSNGKRVLVYKLPQWSTIQKIRLPELSNGIYLARIVCLNYFDSKKFIIQK